MIDMNRDSLVNQYNVRVGHRSVTVKGRTQKDAIEQARRVLSMDMPRLYDVIYRLAHDRFTVDRVPG